MRWTLAVALVAIPMQAGAMTLDCRYNISTAFDYRGDWQQSQSREDFVATYSDINVQSSTAKVTGNSGTADAVVFRGRDGIILIESRIIGEILTKTWISESIPEILAVQLRPQSLNGRVATQTLHGKCQLRR